MQNLYLTLIFILNLIFGFNFMLKIKFGKRDKISSLYNFNRNLGLYF